ncbi:hypothetical protein JCM15060_15850 [Halanaerobaculum tunisiense]
MSKSSLLYLYLVHQAEYQSFKNKLKEYKRRYWSLNEKDDILALKIKDELIASLIEHIKTESKVIFN